MSIFFTLLCSLLPFAALGLSQSTYPPRFRTTRDRNYEYSTEIRTTNYWDENGTTVEFSTEVGTTDNWNENGTTVEFSTEVGTTDYWNENGTTVEFSTEMGTTDYWNENGTTVEFSTEMGTTDYWNENGTTVEFSTEMGTTDYWNENGTTVDYSTENYGTSEMFPETTLDPEYSTPTTGAMNSRGYYGAQVSWNSVSSPAPGLPILVQSQNSSNFIMGSVWQFQGGNVSNFIEAESFNNTVADSQMKPLCHDSFKEQKKIDSAWSKCEKVTGLSNVTNISNSISPCFAKCLMDKLKLLSSKSVIKEKDLAKAFKLKIKSSQFGNQTVREEATMWQKCITEIKEATKDIYGGINSSCENHATFLICGLQQITENCSMSINGQNLTFMADLKFLVTNSTLAVNGSLMNSI